MTHLFSPPRFNKLVVLIELGFSDHKEGFNFSTQTIIKILKAKLLNPVLSVWGIFPEEMLFIGLDYTIISKLLFSSLVF